MNKLKPRNKICFQQKGNIHINLKLNKLKKKKREIYKKRLKHLKEEIPEQRKYFYQKRLFEKQLLKNFYGSISEYKLKNLIKLFKKQKKKNIIKNLIINLEQRLDINLVRLKLVKSIYQAKQIINHNKVIINNKIINKSNFKLKKGDIIKLKNK